MFIDRRPINLCTPLGVPSVSAGLDERYGDPLAIFLSQLLSFLRSTNPHAHSSRKSYLMANTFSQIYIQTVFAVSGRISLITSDFKEELHKYITGIVTKQGQKLISINGMPDHLHILIGLKPSMALANLVRDIKSDSSEWINKKNWHAVNSRGRKVMVHFLTATHS
jgi:REP element-mobilizing transposase RayT